MLDLLDRLRPFLSTKIKISLDLHLDPCYTPALIAEEIQQHRGIRLPIRPDCIPIFHYICHTYIASRKKMDSGYFLHKQVRDLYSKKCLRLFSFQSHEFVRLWSCCATGDFQ